MLKKGVFGNCPEDTIISYTQCCSALFPLSTVFNPPATRPAVTSLLTSDPSYLPSKTQVQKADKDSGKNAAMSVLSGDINDTGVTGQKSSGTNTQCKGKQETNLIAGAKEQKETDSVGPSVKA